MPVFQHLHTDSCIAPTGFLGREKDWKSQQKHVKKIAEFVKEKKTLKKRRRIILLSGFHKVLRDIDPACYSDALRRKLGLKIRVKRGQLLQIVVEAYERLSKSEFLTCRLQELV